MFFTWCPNPNVRHRQNSRGVYGGLRLLAVVIIVNVSAPLLADDGEQSETADPPVRVSVRSDGITILKPGLWGTLRLSVVNTQEEPANLLSTTSIGEDENLQFGRRIWVPPRSRLQTSHYVLAPARTSAEQQHFDLQSLLFDAGSSAEIPIPQQFGRPKQEGTIRIARDESVTVILDDPNSMVGDSPNRVAMADFVHATRYENSLWRNLIPIANAAIPTGEMALDAVDHLVIVNDQLTHDLAALRGLRRWLYGGGRLWVMLDRVDPILLEELLGDDYTGKIVDRVGLTTVAIESGPARQTESMWSAEYEQPVDLVRVLSSDLEVDYLVNGWPASFWMNCGQGRLLVTTLAADGWGRPRTPHDPSPPTGSAHQNHFFPGPPLQQLAVEFFVPRNPPPFQPDIAEEHVRAYVGYSIPPRSVVLGLLAGFVIVLTGLGRWLSRSGRLEWMGLLGPVVALMCGSTLVATGHLHRDELSSSVASVQFVQPISGTGDVRVTGTSGVSSPDSGMVDLSGTQGGWVLPDLAGLEGTTKRLIWTDLDRWQWENLPGTPGMRTGTLLESQCLAEPVSLSCQLDQHGVVGQFSLPAGLSPSDGMLITRAGRIGVEFEDGQTLRARAGQVLADDQYLQASVLTDEQIRRRQSLERMLGESGNEQFLRQPQLWFWTEAWDLASGWGERFHNTGSALVTMPVNLRRPAAGTEITIPAPLLPYREAAGPDGYGITSFFNWRRNQWAQKYLPTSNWLQFQVPPSLLPIAPQSARLVIRVDGPVGKLSVAGLRGDQVAPIKTWTDPVGRLIHEVDDPELLSLTDDGHLLLRVSGGDPDRPELTQSSGEAVQRISYWRIESLSLELRARIPDQSQ